jgi:hypothetical protein
MRKKEELSNPKSCINKAKDNEMTFVLLGRDIAAPYAIREWVEKRIWEGKNKRNDPQIIEALQCASIMENERIKKGKGKSTNG